MKIAVNLLLMVELIGFGEAVALAAVNEMMNACRGLGIDGNDFVVAHRVYRRPGGQE